MEIFKRKLHTDAKFCQIIQISFGTGNVQEWLKLCPIKCIICLFSDMDATTEKREQL
jgi:hypothetical protein